MRRLRLNTILLLPGALYVALAIFWQFSSFYVPIGDERNYLTIAYSIVSEGDVRGFYEDYLELYPNEKDAGGAGNARDYSVHGVGLPLLISLPYLIGGATGARVFVALLAALWPPLFYRVARRITGSKLLATGLALVLSLSLPYLAASNQLYPDLLGGLIILYAAERTGTLLLAEEGKITPPSNKEVLFVGSLLAFMPWLHLRFAAPALVLTVGYIYGLSSSSWRRSYLAVIPLTLSLALLAYYNEYAFDNPLGPYNDAALSHNAREVGMVFLGLHLDGMQGMFMQQPLLFLGLLGIAPLARANAHFALLLAIVYLSVVLPNAAHTNIYGGGGSFAGRFGWAVVSLWVFPLSCALSFLWHRTKALVVALFAAAFGLQVWLASKWIAHEHFLYNRYDEGGPPRPGWPEGGLYAGLPGGEVVSSRVPFFGDFDFYLHHTFNYVFVLGCVFLILAGLLYRRSSRE